MSNFSSLLNQAYTFEGSSFLLGGAVLDGQVVADTQVHLPLRTLNRHGLIAGATGTGKTKTLQYLTESLSKNGVSVVVMDMKGDFSGISQPGTSNEKIAERSAQIGYQWQPEAFPVEFLSLTGQQGVPLRATVTEFGPVLFSKILELNDTQSGVVSLIFKYCDDKQLPLVDLKDFKKVLQYLTNEGKKEIEAEYGAIAPATTSTIIRKIIELEQQKADQFFGEISFDVNDLVRIDENGKGYIYLLRLMDMMDRPKLFSTFMLSLLAEIYATFPEEGDVEQPKLVLFIDEAHLIFKEASKALLDQIETIIKLIRSKGVGIYFCTQNPKDIPASILAQLGLKIQHALRAFTAADRDAIEEAAKNYPITEFYKTDELLTQLGIGEALVTALNEKGNPTPLVHTLIAPPSSRMDTISDAELSAVVAKSGLQAKYAQVVDEKSAFEILSAKMQQAQQVQAQAEAQKVAEKQAKEAAKAQAKQKEEPTMLESVLKNPVAKSVTNTVMREVTRGLLGALGLKSKRGGWF